MLLKFLGASSLARWHMKFLKTNFIEFRINFFQLQSQDFVADCRKGFNMSESACLAFIKFYLWAEAQQTFVLCGTLHVQLTSLCAHPSVWARTRTCCFRCSCSCPACPLTFPKLQELQDLSNIYLYKRAHIIYTYVHMYKHLCYLCAWYKFI